MDFIIKIKYYAREENFYFSKGLHFYCKNQQLKQFKAVFCLLSNETNSHAIMKQNYS
jgi:hypothetical protein